MFQPRTGLVALVLTIGFALHAASADQEKPAASSTAAEYAGTDVEGNYQKALEAAIRAAHEGVSHAGGKVISDAMLRWEVVSVSGTYGGFAGKRDVTVTVRARS